MSDLQSSSAVIAGFRFTPAEFQLGLEIIKATLLAFSGGAIAYLYNTGAKAREQDGALFNDFIKKRIDALHHLNIFVADFANEYLKSLEIEEMYTTHQDYVLSSFETKRREAQFNQQQKARDFLDKQMADLRRKIISESASLRYIIGEANYREFCERVTSIEVKLQDIWDHFHLVGLFEARDIATSSADAVASNKDFIEILFAQNRLAWRNHAEVSKEWLLEEIDRIQVRFEKIVRSKGLYRRSWINIIFGKLWEVNKRRSEVQAPFMSWFDHNQVTETSEKIRNWRSERLRPRID